MNANFFQKETKNTKMEQNGTNKTDIMKLRGGKWQRPDEQNPAQMDVPKELLLFGVCVDIYIE
jgi:hypothetical protein